MVQVVHADAALVLPVPLVENAVQVRTRSVLPTQGSPDIHHVLLIDRFLESKWLIRSILLSFEDGLFKPLGRPITSRHGKSSTLIRVHSDVALIGLIHHLGCGACVVSSEDLVGPLSVFQLSRFLVSDEDWSLRCLPLSVIELERGFLFWVCDLLQTPSCLKAVLAHSTHICELHGGVKAFLLLRIALSSKVDVRETALVRPLLSHVHLCAFTLLLISNQFNSITPFLPKLVPPC